MLNRAPIFAAAREIIRELPGQGEWDWATRTIAIMDAAINSAEGHAAAPVVEIQRGLSPADFKYAADMLGCTVAQIRAVWEVECSGNGWFTDVRGDILALDGPGGFIDGAHLPKILFEAHWFARHTQGRFNKSHPNISSPVWKRSLYIGGVGEWERLHRAMQLDTKAALLSASVGAPQIMGFNHKKAGYDTVEGFWDAMKRSERNHLSAFCAFVKNSGLVAALRRISNYHADCRPFASGYNGEAYDVHDYDGKIARAHKKWSES